MPETTTLRIKANKLGSVTAVKNLLTDIESAYNSIYAFDFLVETLASERAKKSEIIEDRMNQLRKYWDRRIQREYPYDPFIFDYFFDILRSGQNSGEMSLLELQRQTDINKIVLPSDRLSINKVNIQSPGFWEFFGSLNPLQQMREYLNDRHERKKDKKYRSRQEEELGDLTIMEKKNNILNQRIETLRGLGFSETEIRQMVMSMVIEPLNRLGEHQNNGEIDGTEE
jgi:hypothetical protein